MITFDSFVISSLLGDGYLPKESIYYYGLFFQHSLKQEEYALYKKNIAESLGMDTKVYYINKNFPAIRVKCSLDKSYFKKMKHKIYPNGNKTITRSLLNLLDADGLSLWWQDDGCLSIYRHPIKHNTSRYGKLCTHGFSKEENIIISNYFSTVWKIETQVTMEKGKYYFQRLNATNLNKFFDIINVHESMKYKTDMKYTNFVPRVS
jgi:hypothetical protein